MAVPYYLRKKITNIIISTFMLAFLALTLLPIFWMVFSSLKDSTDIAVGRIGLRRASPNVAKLQVEEQGLWVLTANGGINLYDKNDLSLKKKKGLNAKAASYVIDDKYIWAATADKGLIRVEKNDLGRVKKFKLPIYGIKLNKVSATSIVKDYNDIYIALDYRGFENILHFNTRTQNFKRVINAKNRLSPYSITDMALQGQALWLSTDRGLVEVDLASEKTLNTYPLRKNRLRVRVNRLVKDGHYLYLSTPVGLMQFDLYSRGVVRTYDSNNGLYSSQIGAIIKDKNIIYVGTNLGASVIDLKTSKIRHLFKDGEVLSITTNQNDLYVGSTSGKFSRFDLVSAKMIEAKAPKGRLVAHWSNYVDMWKNVNFGLYLRNSIIICSFTMLFSMILSTMAAYSLSRFRFPGSDLFSNSILATQMIPAIMYLIPLYIMFVRFTAFTGIPVKGTFPGLILIYSAFFTPFAIWILRGFFAAIPKELEEAARIDGCSAIQVFWKVALPLAIPGIIATGIYVFLTAWDELMFAWVLTNADTMTIPVGIRLFVGNFQNRFDLMMAAATVATIPVILLFFALQKYIIKGLTAGAVKG